MACEYVRQYHGVPAEIGRRVEWGGRQGVIAEDRGNYLGVLFDDAKPGSISILHPTDGVVYLDMGPVRQMTAAQKRYRDYRSADWFTGTFMDWCRRTSTKGSH
jgi:hypothetical protein